MTCEVCAVNPYSHSFNPYATVGPITYYYTAPALATERIKTNEQYAMFKKHLDQAVHWIWIFDCSGMGVDHYTSIAFLQNIVGTLVTEHDTALQEVLIIHPSFWIHSAVWAMYPFMNANLHRKIRFIPNKKDLDLELLAKKVHMIA
jgi:CRAL/TRIO domain